MVSAQARLEQVRCAVQRGLSQRRACALMGAGRSGLHYELRMPAKDAPVIEAMRNLSGQFPRFGARRINIFLARQGMRVSKDRCSRIWSAAGLQVPPRKKRRRGVARTSPRPMSPLGRNCVWCYDFVFDSCANGQQLKCLTVVDEYTRECLAIDVAGSIRSRRVIDVLSKLISVHGAPRYLRSDNGPEFVSLALLNWAKDGQLETVLSDPGKPWQNGTNESMSRHSITTHHYRKFLRPLGRIRGTASGKVICNIPYLVLHMHFFIPCEGEWGHWNCFINSS
jgi:putative transposase